MWMVSKIEYDYLNAFQNIIFRQIFLHWYIPSRANNPTMGSDCPSWQIERNIPRSIETPEDPPRHGADTDSRK